MNPPPRYSPFDVSQGQCPSGGTVLGAPRELRILHVIANIAPRYGGPGRAAQDMCRSLAARGHHVELFTTNQDGEGVLPVPIGVPVPADRYWTTFFEFSGPSAYRISKGLCKALERRMAEFDVVDIHNLYLFHTIVASAVARRRHIPYVIRPHGTFDRYQRKRHPWRKRLYLAAVERRNLDGAAAIHYTTEQERLEAAETGIRAPGCVVPLGIDVDLYARPTDERDLPPAIPRNVPLVTFMGRLAVKKGADIVVAAFGRVVRRGGKAHLVLAGPDSDGLQRQLERQVSELGVANHVTFTGMLTGAPKLALLQRSRLFVLPSQDENFGIAVVEALAAGVPVVVSRGVAIHPDIDAARAGLVVDRTTEAVADAIDRLLSDDAMAERMASAAGALAREKYSLEAMGDGLERMYEFVLSGRLRDTGDPS
ncbi:MAG: glycosyltransferase [Candidatus Limnocylindrales bacterium]